MAEVAQEQGAPRRVSARLEPDGSGGIVLLFDAPDGSRRIYDQPNLNQTPAQSASILKLRAVYGPSLDLTLGDGSVRASIRFDESGEALLSVFDLAGRLSWTAPIAAEHAVPDVPLPDPPRRAYRWIAAAFTLFFLILTAFILIVPVAGVDFYAKASIGFSVAVASCIFLLLIWNKRKRS